MQFPVRSAVVKPSPERETLTDRLKGQPTPEESKAAISGEIEAKRQALAVSEKTKAVATAPTSGDMSAIYQLIVNGDLSRLNQQQRLQYYKHVCESLGLNPSTKPLEFIVLNGKMVLYALKECSAQLARIHSVSVEVISREKIVDEAVFEVVCRARTPDGRLTDEVGAVPFGAKLAGEAAANARMKAVTKAKRRAVLSHCGLGVLDESELDTIPAEKKQEARAPAPEPLKDPEPVAKVSAPVVQQPPVIEAEVEEKPPVETKQDDRKAESTTGSRPVAGDPFRYEETETRQRLIKEIKSRFPALKRGDFIKLGEKYKFADQWPVILNDLDRMAKAGAVDFEGY